MDYKRDFSNRRKITKLEAEELEPEEVGYDNPFIKSKVKEIFTEKDWDDIDTTQRVFISFLFGIDVAFNTENTKVRLSHLDLLKAMSEALDEFLGEVDCRLLEHFCVTDKTSTPFEYFLMLLRLKIASNVNSQCILNGEKF